MSTTVARTMSSIPARTASETWRAIVNLIAPSDEQARTELLGVEGIACSLITDKAMTAPIIVTGKGPRVRIYCQYDEDAISGDDANESALATKPTEEEWAVSMPCEEADLSWVQEALKKKSSRITARDKSLGIRLSQSDEIENSTHAVVLFDEEAFLRK